VFFRPKSLTIGYSQKKRKKKKPYKDFETGNQMKITRPQYTKKQEKIAIPASNPYFLPSFLPPDSRTEVPRRTNFAAARLSPNRSSGKKANESTNPNPIFFFFLFFSVFEMIEKKI
jgi:hypothetical protein